jgi:hyperosmotically inducible protein
MLQRLAALVGVAALTVACAQTDAGITTNIKSKMASDDTVKAHQINVDTSNGVVTLRGDVDSALARERAVQIARGTTGVREVVDHITVTAAAPTGGLIDRDDAGGYGQDRGVGTVVGDAAITSAVKTKFLADRTVSGLKIDVDTKDGVVTLTGNVSSRTEADHAVMMARNTEGVMKVIDNLKVVR